MVNKFIYICINNLIMATIDEEVKAKFMNERHRFATNLVFTSGWIKNLFEKEIKPYGISGQQFNILRILRGAKDWMAMNDVKSIMIEKSPNATRLADKLLDKHLIERNRSETDRRVVYVRISKEGLELLKKIDETENEIQIALRERISEEEAKQMSGILDRLRG